MVGTIIVSFPVVCVLASKLGTFSKPEVFAAAATIQPDFAYTGLFYHQRSGLYFAQGRAYDSGLKRWVNRDPIGEQGGVNLYGYVANGPLTRRDPSGQFAAAPPSPLPPFPKPPKPRKAKKCENKGLPWGPGPIPGLH
jgi:RHS repeat-associated protein